MIVANDKPISLSPLNNGSGSAIPINKANNRNLNGIHQASNNKVFTKDSTDIPEELKDPLSRYLKHKDDFAVLSKDNNGQESLVLALTGKSLYKNFFYDPWYYKPIRWFKTFFSWIFRFKPKLYNHGLVRFKELFIPNSTNNLEYRGEDTKHLIKNLKGGAAKSKIVNESSEDKGHYYGQVLLYKDPATGKFKKEPEMITITDSNEYAANHEAFKLKLSQKEIEQHSGFYMIDKVLPFSKKDHSRFTPNLVRILDSLLSAKPEWYKAFELNFKISDQHLNELKETHQVKELQPWHISLMKNNGSFENMSSKLTLIGPKSGDLRIPPKFPEIISRIMTSSGAIDLAEKYKDEIQKTINQNYETLQNNELNIAA